MKNAMKLLAILGSFILIVMGAIFAIINIRILLAGEFLLANNPAASFFFYFFRTVVFLFYVYSGMIAFFRKKSDTIVLMSSVAGGICIVFSLLMFIGYEWYFALVFFLGSLLVSLQIIPLDAKKKVEEKQPE